MPLAILLPLLGLGAKAPGRYIEQFSCEGRERSYILRIPRTAATGKPLPLVIVLHGWTASGAIAEAYTGMGAKSESAGFVAAFPDGTGPKGRLGWNADFLDLSGQRLDDVAFVDKLIDRIAGETPVDRKRVFVCGHSNGAFLSHDVAARLGSKVRAIAAVAGTIGLDRVKPPRLIQTPKAPVSVLIIHGMKDPLVPYDRKSKALLGSVSAPESAVFWARVDSAKGPTIASFLNTMKIEEWRGGKSGTLVRLVSLKNGTHDWPGGPRAGGKETASGANAADLIWSFFEQVSR